MHDTAEFSRPTATAWLSRAWPWLLIAILGAVAFYWEGLVSLRDAWSRPEYSYGPMVPFITGYLTLREIHRRPIMPDTGSRFWGYVAFALAIALGLLGNLVQIPDIITYGFILFIGAVILTLAGTREGVRFWPGWLHLIFMLPLPNFIYLSVSTKLQIVSSVIGVSFIEFAHVPVLLDGNIIDLGVYKLQVAEACSGLRYLFPLFSFGWLMAVLYNGPKWHRVVIFASTVPVTILMNSFRIGVIGILVNSFGISQAEGFLHFFEGWIIFIACTLILYAEAWILFHFFTFGAKPTRHVLRVDLEGIFEPLKKFAGARTTTAFAVISILALAAGVAWQLQPAREISDVSRSPLGIFPTEIGDWKGQATHLDRDVERVLAADDYLIAGYQNGGQEIGLLLTFYKSQTEGSGIHSPEVCLPSGGWEVSRWEQTSIPLRTSPLGGALRVNRAIIQLGLSRQLVYYWFEERGKQTPNDFEAKFMSMWDTVLSGRSDGGLVRLTTPIGDTETEASAEARLNGFLQQVVPLLPHYFPPTSA